MIFEIDQKMRKKWNQLSKIPQALIGFDGFVDTIAHVVAHRISKDSYERVPTITKFAERIASAANLSANLEIVPKKVKLGGNGPIMANALLAQDVSVSYIGALGNPKLHPVFQDFAARCESVYSLSEPGFTDAMEFSDGKIMLGKLTTLKNINWETILKTIPDKELDNLLKDKDLIAFTNWTMLPELNSIIIEFGNRLQKIQRKPYLFFDLADPEKRSHNDILELLEILQYLNRFCPVILGLNERESVRLQMLLKMDIADISKRAACMREKLQIAYLVIHPTYGAAAASAEHSCWVDGPYTKNPRLTTGAGDHFNAGFCNGLLHKLSLEEALKIGVFTSGFYVREMRSPTLQEIFTYTCS